MVLLVKSHHMVDYAVARLAVHDHPDCLSMIFVPEADGLSHRIGLQWNLKKLNAERDNIPITPLQPSVYHST
jgi:hypothetical protein